MNTFKAYRSFEENGKAVSRFVEMTTDELDAGEVLIKSEYSTVNYKDALSATGAGRIIRRFPCNGGIDVAGTVESSTDARFQPGDPVLCNSYDFGVAHDGGYAEYCRVPAQWAVPLPKGLNSFEAMCLGVAGFTAGLAVERMEHCGLKPENGPVVVDGATGGVGSVAIEVLAGLGYHVVALTGKEGEGDYLRGLGAKEVLLRQSLDLTRIKPLDKAMWAGAIDNLGGETLAWMASTMKIGGCLASVGLAASPALNTTVMPFILRGVSLLGIDSVNCPMAQRLRIWNKFADAWKPVKTIAAVRSISFDRLPDVFDDFLRAKVTGRVVVKIGR
jgi:putative YhdH/YhfP family quinone oxidoreductase